MFWGISPALDLQDKFLKCCNHDVEELNFLIIGGSDARHIIKTLAQSYRHERRNLNFYVIDGCPELIARQYLFMSLVLEKTTQYGILEKTRRLLEIYGNILLRPSSSRYLLAKSKQLINMITNQEYCHDLLSCITIDQMKYRERDYIENLMKYWLTGNANNFDVCQLWESRLRQSLGVRYDSRVGVYDWDYHMRMKEIASAICFQEYKHFREHGVAFTWLETEVSRPNTTLAAGVYKCGDRFLHRGYLGDLVSSPYIAYGLDCEDKYMMQSSHGVNYKRATDISERNLMRMLYEIENRKPFVVDSMNLDKDQQNLGMVVMSQIDAKISENGIEAPLTLREDKHTYIDLDYSKINFVSHTALEHYPNKPEFQDFFHCIFLGHNISHLVKPNLWLMAKNESVVMMETRKYMVDLKREDVKSFGDVIKKIADTAPLTLIEVFDPEKDDVAMYMVEKCENEKH